MVFLSWPADKVSSCSSSSCLPPKLLIDKRPFLFFNKERSEDKTGFAFSERVGWGFE